MAVAGNLWEYSGKRSCKGLNFLLLEKMEGVLGCGFRNYWGGGVFGGLEGLEEGLCFFIVILLT